MAATDGLAHEAEPDLGGPPSMKSTTALDRLSPNEQATSSVLNAMASATSHSRVPSTPRVDDLTANEGEDDANDGEQCG